MAGEKPDYVNDVPERYGKNWPPKRRCGYVFSEWGMHRERPVRRRPCGYPCVEGEAFCIFHSGSDRDWIAAMEEIEHAAADGAHFQEARLEGMKLGDPNLTGARLYGARLGRADLSIANLTEAELCGADLSGANLFLVEFSDASLGLADMSGANLRAAIFGGEADLKRAVLTHTHLAEAEFSPRVDLDGVLWWRRAAALRKVMAALWHAARGRRLRRVWSRMRAYRRIHHPARVFRDERELSDRPPQVKEERDRWSDTIAGCERTYRQVKRCYQDSGQYEEAGQFFIREMECKRKQSHSPVTRAIYRLMHFLCDYGENPWRVVGIGLFLVLTMALVQGLIGVQVAPEGKYVVGPGVYLGTLKQHCDAVIRAVYFSVMTYTATGYGDYVPRPGVGQVLAATEAVCGVFLMALFLVCLARKYGRA